LLLPSVLCTKECTIHVVITARHLPLNAGNDADDDDITQEDRPAVQPSGSSKADNSSGTSGGTDSGSTLSNGSDNEEGSHGNGSGNESNAEEAETSPAAKGSTKSAKKPNREVSS